MKRLLLLLPVALLALALAAPATAETVVVTDPAGDARAWSWDPEPKPCGTVTEDSTEVNDVRRLVVRHTADRVVLALAVDRLGRPRDTHAEFLVTTPRRAWDVSMSWWRGRYHVDLSRPFQPPPDAEDDCVYVDVGTSRSCRGTVAGIDRAAGRVRISLTRECLGSPRWVRADAYVSSYVDEVFYSDHQTRMTPRVHAETR